MEKEKLLKEILTYGLREKNKVWSANDIFYSNGKIYLGWFDDDIDDLRDYCGLVKVVDYFRLEEFEETVYEINK